MGFHAPQEAARVLGEAADLARQGQVAVMSWQLKSSSGGAEADQDSDQGADTQE